MTHIDELITRHEATEEVQQHVEFIKETYTKGETMMICEHLIYNNAPKERELDEECGQSSTEV